MKRYILIGIILVVMGIIVLAYHGIIYTTRLPLPRIVGVIALVGGIVLLFVGNKKVGFHG